MRQGQNAGTEILLDGEKFTLGRRKACEIPVGDVKASRNHAQIFRQGNRFYVRDLASRNGTFLNGERLAGDSELSFGDKISIGDTIMEFAEESAGKPIDFEIPGYQIIERVGEGGMGIVYKARQVSMDRVVALKVLSEKYSSNGEFIDRFIREARAAGKLNHPNVIHVHDVSRAGGRNFFSMEFVDGPSVKKLLKQSGRLPVGKCMEIIVQAAKALEFAHENGIIHRDVKPDNIMLTSEGIVKIADLGIAKSFEEEDPAQQPGKRRVLGTPHYMAPEQAMGKALDRRADVYSLGATFYHMLTGTTPFKGTTVAELLKAHVQERLEPVQHLNAEVPDAVCFVVERMMAKLPEKRYENMTRLLEDLERVQRDSGTAQIERLAPEDSTIMRAVDAKAAAEARGRAAAAAGQVRAPARSGAGLRVATLLVAAALVAILAFVAIVLYKKVRDGGSAPDAGGSTGGTGTTEQKSEAAQALDRLRAIPASREEEILREAVALTGRFSGTEEAAAAQKMIDDIKARQARLLEAEVAKAVEAAEKVDKDKPNDLEARILAWDSIAKHEKFAGMEVAKRAAAEVAALRGRQSAAETGARQKKAAEAEEKVKAALGAKDFVEAARILTILAAEFPEADEGKRAAERAKEIEAAADKLLADAEKSAGAAADAGRFDEAAKILKDLEASVKNAKWLPEVPKKIDAIKAKAKEAFDKAYKPVEDLARSGKLTDASREARSLLERYRGTPQEAQIRELLEGIGLQPALFRKVVAAIGKQGSKEITFKPEATLLPGKWFVHSADEDKVTLTSPSFPGADSPLLWAKLSAKDSYGIYMMYMTAPTPEDHRALAFYCAMRGLTAEAENHRKLAGEGK
ncbi:MAG TPA: protein kinase [Planctomycetota bacterium]|nr:protein kinase [Planctomycetota bacterium]